MSPHLLPADQAQQILATEPDTFDAAGVTIHTNWHAPTVGSVKANPDAWTIDRDTIHLWIDEAGQPPSWNNARHATKATKHGVFIGYNYTAPARLNTTGHYRLITHLARFHLDATGLTDAARLLATTRFELTGTPALIGTPARFRATTEALGLDQRAVATYLGCDERTVRRWVAGKVPVSEKAWQRIIQLRQKTTAIIDHEDTRLNDEPFPQLTTYNNDTDFWADHPEAQPLPAAWHRRVAAELIRRHPHIQLTR